VFYLFTDNFTHSVSFSTPKNCLLGILNSDWLRAGRQRGRSSIPVSVKNLPFSTSSRPAVGPTQHPIRWVLEAKWPDLKLATHLKLVLVSRKRGFIHPLCHTPLWRSAYLVKHRDNFTFTLLLPYLYLTVMSPNMYFPRRTYLYILYDSRN
jgi:hypothetical protein